MERKRRRTVAHTASYHQKKAVPFILCALTSVIVMTNTRIGGGSGGVHKAVKFNECIPTVCMAVALAHPVGLCEDDK
jgi:hypothetical protein